MDADERVVGGAGRLRETGKAAGEGRVCRTPDPATVGCGDDEATVAATHDEVELVDETVVPVAQEDEVRKIGAAAEQPVPHVMYVQALDACLVAAGARAATVPAEQRPALRLAGSPLPAPQRERFATLLEHRHDSGLAQHASGHRRRERGATLEVRAACRGVVGEDGGVDVHDHFAAGRIAGSAAGVGGHLGQRCQCGDPSGGGAFAGVGDVVPGRRVRFTTGGSGLRRPGALAPGVSLRE